MQEKVSIKENIKNLFATILAYNLKIALNNYNKIKKQSKRAEVLLKNR